MTPATETLPHRSEPILPASHSRVRRAPVLDKQELAGGLEHASHLSQGRIHVGDRTECPGGHHGVDALVLQWERLRGTLDEFGRPGACGMYVSRHREQPGRWIEPDHLRGGFRVEREVKARAYPNFQHAT